MIKNALGIIATIALLVYFFSSSGTKTENAPTKTQTFKSYECTADCSGHEAGYNWAMEKGITDPNDCGGNSQSFIEGCKAYAYE